MPAATNQQVQDFADQQVRPLCESVRSLHSQIVAVLSEIGDVYTALNVQSPSWTDSRTDGPPHLAQPSDILAMNTFFTDLKNAIEGDGQWPVAQNLCVRPLGE